MSGNLHFVESARGPRFGWYRITKAIRVVPTTRMTRKPPTALLAVLLAAAVIGSIVAMGAVATQSDGDGDTQQTSYVRVVHASPDAPAVDVSVDNETVLSNVSFGSVSDYLSLEAGTYNVTVASTENGTVVFEGELTLDPRSVTTVAVSGEISEGAESQLLAVAYEDDAWTPESDESALRVVHLSPDAPTVDVTAANGSVVLADNVSFRESSGYVTVPAGDYTVEIRAATATNDGAVVATVDASLAGGTAYSALAVGYLNASTAPVDAPFRVVATEDATSSVELPSDDEETPATATAAPDTETATAVPGTETATAEPDTETPTTEPGTDTATAAPMTETAAPGNVTVTQTATVEGTASPAES